MRTSMTHRLLLSAAVLCLVSLGRADDLPPELKKEQPKISAQIAALEERLARMEKGAAEEAVRELKTAIKEFSIEAELLKDDPIISKWNKRLTDLTAKAEVFAKEK